ncbi:MAG: hypothetical protein U0457_19995 [Candidatus Sericytochromatia bacterium]
MSITAVNSVNAVSAYTNSTPTVQKSSLPPMPQNIYGNDSVSILSRSANEMSVFAGGAVAGYRYHEVLGQVGSGLFSSIKSGSPSEMVGALSDGVKNLGQTSLQAAGVGALIAGGTSLVTNTVAFAAGRKDIGDATADMVGTTIKGAVGGVGGVFGGGVFSGAAKLLGFSGTPVLVVGVIGGVVGAAMANKALDTSNIAYKIRNAFN